MSPQPPAPTGNNTAGALGLSGAGTAVPARRTTGDLTPPGSGHSSDYESGDGEIIERVVNIKTCPLCHRPRMNAKAEMDIITHLAVCASQDWARVDRIVVGNFVTASQAQRKWYSKVMTAVSAGSYQLGAVSCTSFLSAFLYLTSDRIEFCQHHRTEPHYWSARRRKDARLCPHWHSSPLQGA